MRKTDQYLNYLAKVPMFSACSKKELQVLGRAVEDVEYASGTTVISEGGTGREFFVITEGSASVTRKGKEVARLGSGDFFGELSLLDPSERDATVTATTKLRTSVLGQREFVAVLADVPSISLKLMRGLARRIHELEARS